MFFAQSLPPPFEASGQDGATLSRLLFPPNTCHRRITKRRNN
jgi:hypothetical protein